jgi:hypothetical protein
MRNLESLIIKYLGFNNPNTEEEVEITILGLETIIATAQQKIAILKQSSKVNDFLIKQRSEGTDEKTVAETPEIKEDK